MREEREMGEEVPQRSRALVCFIMADFLFVEYEGGELLWYESLHVNPV